MNKYALLGEFLRKQRLNQVRMTFAEIERITGTRLPPSAQRHRAWWSNNPSNSAMTRVWLDAGYITECVDMEGRRLVFRRARDRTAGESRGPPPAGEKAKQHPLIGALKGLMRVAPGTDLTKPADPDWGRDR